MSRLVEDLPKTELHLHIEGSLEPSMVMELARRNNVDFPHATETELLATYEFDNLAGFSKVYQSSSRVLRTERDFNELTQAYMRRVRQDNVRHVEIAFAPQGASSRGVDPVMALEGVLAGFEEAKAEHGMTGGIIIGCQRHRGIDDAMRMLDQVRPYRDRIMAIGLASLEVGNPPSIYRRLFEEARELGWKAVAHAGEEGPPEYIWEAIDILKVDRIDHGVRCEEDPALMRRLAEQQIPLTVCPLSNVYLKVFPTLERHNVARLLRAGLCVTINSDDPPYFGGYVNENYIQSQAALGLGDAELVQLARNSFVGSFMDDTERQRHLADIDAVWLRHAGEAAPAHVQN
ncbi:adenosine deaminase [Aquibium sp. ELW1220]|uniref:adenosine deaminase n=1 Tax=Aquibium sp. ELW1220 TaxID=2976766 RepID=UPI0025B1ECC5|nr:adenosine deaminase [Aquibium sp. ELW1220]MDN2581180.1 adenosine deaminase [Aquibium sp. ELW1220]